MCASCARRKASTSSGSKSNKDNIFTSLYYRVADWITTKRNAVLKSSHDQNNLNCKHRRAMVKRPNGFIGNFPDLSSPNNGNHVHLSPDDHAFGRSPLSSDCSVGDSLHLASSSCSSYTVISTPSMSGSQTPYCHSNTPNSPCMETAPASQQHRQCPEFVLDCPQVIQKLVDLRTDTNDVFYDADDVTCRRVGVTDDWLARIAGLPPAELLSVDA